MTVREVSDIMLKILNDESLPQESREYISSTKDCCWSLINSYDFARIVIEDEDLDELLEDLEVAGYSLVSFSNDSSNCSSNCFRGPVSPLLIRAKTNMKNIPYKTKIAKALVLLLDQRFLINSIVSFIVILFLRYPYFLNHYKNQPHSFYFYLLTELFLKQSHHYLLLHQYHLYK